MFPPFNWVYTGILNVLEMPATQVPLGLGREGLPVGVQVAALDGCDDRTIAVALELERAFGGWVPPFDAGDSASGSKRELVASPSFLAASGVA
jgi:fatty acid amide hydrolase 2